MSREILSPRRCLIDPIPEISDAAIMLDAAVSAHLRGDALEAERLLRLADMPLIAEWTESMWGRSHMMPAAKASDAPFLPKDQRVPARMPTKEQKRMLHERDGYHCRFCGIPVIRVEIRNKLRSLYPSAVRWGKTNAEQHAALQAMWAQYDHVLPHARGGDNSLENVIVTCAPCNFARMNSMVGEVGLLDPRGYDPVRSNWDGLERLISRAIVQRVV